MTIENAKSSRRCLLGSLGAVGGASVLAEHARAAQASAAQQNWRGAPFGEGLLKGRVAVITGAARGIGRSIAVDMAANGADIVGIDICSRIVPFQEYPVTTRADMDETARLVREHGRKFTAEIGDVRDIQFLRSVAERTEEHGGVDIVVANAATQVFKPLIEMDDVHWNEVINNNLNGTANTMRAFAPKLVAKGKGRIIVVASMQGKHGSRNMSSYSASKWGIIGL